MHRPLSSSASDAEEAAALNQEEYLLLTSRLHTVLRPFMLRRLKESVAGELPGKVKGRAAGGSRSCRGLRRNVCTCYAR
jgi:hypothetical protein